MHSARSTGHGNRMCPAIRLRYGILLDMVGARGAKFRQEGYSREAAGYIVDKVWSTANANGFSDYFPYQPGGWVTDDHVYVNRMGIPSIDIIGSDPTAVSGFGKHWHTHRDSIDIIDPATLHAVGQTLPRGTLRQSESLRWEVGAVRACSLRHPSRARSPQQQCFFPQGAQEASSPGASLPTPPVRSTVGSVVTIDRELSVNEIQTHAGLFGRFRPPSYRPLIFYRPFPGAIPAVYSGMILKHPESYNSKSCRRTILLVFLQVVPCNRILNPFA